MPPVLTFTVTGIKELQARLEKWGRESPQALKSAMLLEGEAALTKMKRRTPVKTGALKASGRVRVRTGGRDAKGRFVAGTSRSPEIVWSFGGSAIDYAWFVHENLRAHHPVGQSKYVESVLAEARSHIVDRIATRYRKNVGL